MLIKVSSDTTVKVRRPYSGCIYSIISGTPMSDIICIKDMFSKDISAVAVDCHTLGYIIASYISSVVDRRVCDMHSRCYGRHVYMRICFFILISAVVRIYRQRPAVFVKIIHGRYTVFVIEYRLTAYVNYAYILDKSPCAVAVCLCAC